MEFVIEVAQFDPADEGNGFLPNTCAEWGEEEYYGTLEDAITYAYEFMCEKFYANVIEIYQVYNPQLMVKVYQETMKF